MGSVELTPTTRGRIIQKHYEKVSIRSIGKAVDVSKSTAHDTIQRLEKHGRKESLPRPGGPAKTSDRDQRRIIRHLRGNRKSSYTDVAGEFEVSASTIRRVAAANGYHRRIARRKPFLSRRARAKRTTWAQNASKVDWECVVFTDETSVEIGLNPSRVHVTRRPGEEYMEENLQTSFHSSRQSLMVWGAIAFNRKFPLFRVPLLPSSSDGKRRTRAEGLNGSKYAEHVVAGPLKRCCDLLEAEKHKDILVLEDGAPAHSSKVARRAREELGIKTLCHPPSSPDLNPIEPLWLSLKRRVASMTPKATNLDQLWMQIQGSWDAIPLDEVNQQISRMDERKDAVKRSKGGPTGF